MPASPLPLAPSLDPDAETFFDRLMNGPLRLVGDELPTPSQVGAWSVGPLRARGGTGGVYAAWPQDRHASLSGAAMLKLSHETTPEAQAAYAREAAVLRSARSRTAFPVTPDLIDAGVSREGRAFLVTSLVDGRPVCNAASERSLVEQVRIAHAACDAVAVLHAADFAHADLKPEHLLLLPDDRVAVLDLGLAHDLRDQRPLPTGRLTPEFASPEQILGEPPLPATDVYALGLIICEILGGTRSHVPWALGGDPAHAHHDLPPSLTQILAKALAPVPSHRYLDADALGQALAVWLRRGPSGTFDPFRPA